MSYQMNSVQLFLDNQEHFAIQSANCIQKIEHNIALKSAEVSCVLKLESYKDFKVMLQKKNRMLASLYINKKLFLECFITQDSYDSITQTNGRIINFTLSDRFHAIVLSDLILTINKENKTLQNLLANILSELGFVDADVKPTYQKIINQALDFIKQDANFGSSPLKNAGERQGNKAVPSLDVISTALNIHNLILISNGYDTLKITKYNNSQNSIYTIKNTKEESNCIFMRKVSNNARNDLPSKLIVLNTLNPVDKNKNTSAIGNYKYGNRHIQSIRYIELDATYNAIQSGLFFNILGMNAIANSYVYQIPSRLTNNQNNLFEVNQAVKVIDEDEGMEEDMRILSVSFLFDKGTTSTELALCPIDVITKIETPKYKKSLMRKKNG